MHHGTLFLAASNAHPVFEEWDVLHAVSQNSTYYCHAEMICSHRQAPLTSEGYRANGISRMMYDSVCQYRNQVVSASQMKRVETDLTGETISEQIFGDFNTLHGPDGSHPIYANEKDESSLKTAVADAIGEPLQICRMTPVRVNGSRQFVLQIVTSAGVSLAGYSLNIERIHVEQYIRNRKRHNGHRIFEGGVWHSGRVDRSDLATSRAWDIIQNGSGHSVTGVCPECHREHEYWPAGSRDVCCSLIVSSGDFSDVEQEALVSPHMEIADLSSPVYVDGIDLRLHHSNMLRYPGYDPRYGKIIDAVRQADGTVQEVQIDVADVEPLGDDELVSETLVGDVRVHFDAEDNAIIVERARRRFRAPVSDVVLHDIRETIDNVRDLSYPICERSQCPGHSVWGNRDWLRDKIMPRRDDRGELYDKLNDVTVPNLSHDGGDHGDNH